MYYSMPILILSTAIGNVQFISQMFFMSYPRHAFVKMIGTWKEFTNGQLYPVGGNYFLSKSSKLSRFHFLLFLSSIVGFVYLITAPKSISAVLADPLQAVFYAVFMLCACGVCGQMWLDVSGMGARQVSQQLSSKGLSLRGHTNRFAIFLILCNLKILLICSVLKYLVC